MLQELHFPVASVLLAILYLCASQGSLNSFIQITSIY